MTTDRATLDIPAAVLALLFPGAGQMFRGNLYRGVMASMGVLGLFLGGLLIGGIDVVDSKEDRIWFYGEALVGPLAFGVDALHQNRFKAWAQVPAVTGRPGWDTRSGYPNETRTWNDERARYEWVAAANPAATDAPPNKKSIAKMNELGTLFATIAGMLNFIIILDALLPSKRGRDLTKDVSTTAGIAAATVAATAAAELSV